MANLRISAETKWNPTVGPQAGFAIIVCVADAAGAPVTGLQAGSFDALVFDDPGNPVRPPLNGFTEIPGGVYSFGVRGGSPAWFGPNIPTILTVTSGGNSGRIAIRAG